MKTVEWTVLLTALAMAGCGGGGDGGGTDTGIGQGGGGQGGDPAGGAVTIEAVTNLTGSFQYLGFVELIQDNLLDRIDRDSNFLQMTSAQDAAVFRNSVPMAVDTCKLRITPTIPSDATTIGFPEATFNLVSAGESLTLTGDAGTYATINLSEDRFDVATHPAPTPLTLDVPGDEFPAFADVSVPDVEVVQDFRPANSEALQADTTISWTPTGLTDHTINLALFDFPATDRVVDLRCHVADDGEFLLPADVIAALNNSLGSGWSLDGMEQDRRSDSLVINGDALLVISRSLQ
jgi:hypothetical protein